MPTSEFQEHECLNALMPFQVLHGHSVKGCPIDWPFSLWQKAAQARESWKNENSWKNLFLPLHTVSVNKGIPSFKLEICDAIPRKERCGLYSWLDPSSSTRNSRGNRIGKPWLMRTIYQSPHVSFYATWMSK